MKRFTAILLLAAMLLCSTANALAEELELTGTVSATQMVTLTSPAAGKVESCTVSVGDHVDAGAALMTLQTTKVYAEQDGTVYIFGQPGDSVTTLTTRYGGVAYVEPAQRYTISGSTKSAYDADDNKLIHPGEKVYLRSYNNYTLKSTGTVTIVSGTSYTVEVDDDVFISGSTINVYRDAAYTSSSMIGNGKISQASATVYSGTGHLVRLHVQSGQQVSAGDLLYETLDGTFVPGDTDINTVFADQAGVIASVTTGKGQVVTADEAVVELYPDAGMRIIVSVPEDDLARIEPGMTVQYLLPGEEDSTAALTGTVEKISLLPDDDATYGTTYAVSVIPETVAPLRYGLTVTVLIP
ncbi:MAG: HlyD family efflux transporter periplasmic adaptor subunit [Clostridia bacterium]|nr:HlyD family efflux transporter periplasmic adaptor subunit [Clostridia bacterium]